MFSFFLSIIIIYRDFPVDVEPIRVGGAFVEYSGDWPEKNCRRLLEVAAGRPSDWVSEWERERRVGSGLGQNSRLERGKKNSLDRARAKERERESEEKETNDIISTTFF